MIRRREMTCLPACLSVWNETVDGDAYVSQKPGRTAQPNPSFHLLHSTRRGTLISHLFSGGAARCSNDSNTVPRKRGLKNIPHPPAPSPFFFVIVFLARNVWSTPGRACIVGNMAGAVFVSETSKNSSLGIKLLQPSRSRYFSISQQPHSPDPPFSWT